MSRKMKLKQIAVIVWTVIIVLYLNILGAEAASLTATVVAANSLQDGREYILYTGSSNDAYAISHYSEGRDADLVYGANINASTTTGQTFSIDNYGSSIVWTAHKITSSGTTYWTFSYEENGKTYYLRSYGGLMVGADSDIDESGYKDSQRYQWLINDRRLRARYTNDNNRRLRYSNNANGFRERDNNGSSQFYFAEVSSYTQDVPATPTIHYVDESGNELAVINGRDWTSNSTTSPAFLIYDIAGYEYDKTTIASIGGTEIRPLLRYFAGKWQYTSSIQGEKQITWNNIPGDEEETSRLEDIYVVYKTAASPVTGGTPKVKQVEGAEPPAKPEITKSSTVNGDGTNTLTLSVSGHTAPMEVEKLADVIVIFDTSTSMRRHMGTSTTTYEANETPVINYQDHETRLWIAAEAVKDLANMLIGPETKFQDSTHNKLIRMSLISFNRNANIEVGFTDNYSEFETAVNGLTTEAGTNWEAALNKANRMAVDPERATFVIFVTDGNPSYRISRGNLLQLEGYPETINDENLDVNTANSYYFYRVLNYLGALDENDERNYNTAEVIARSIVANKKSLFSIGIGNAAGVSRLQGLTSAAYGSSTIGAANTKTAENQEELAKAFEEFTSSIVALMGHSDIQIKDGITDLTQTVQKSTLVNFAEDDFTYYKGKVVVATEDDVAAGLAAKVGDPIPATQADVDAGLAEKKGGTKVVSWESWDPASEGCAVAVYNTETGAVEWNMGEGFMLEEGYTYQVRFKVWPSQEAYDLLADLNNGKKSYNDLTPEEKAQISEPKTAGGMYTLRTNSDTSYTYREATKTGDTVVPTGEPSEPGSFPEVDPLELTTRPLKIKKEWEHNYVDRRIPETQITLELHGVDPSGTASQNFKTITLTEAEGWYSENNYISYGLVTYNTQTNAGAKIYETGHDFTLRETADETHHYYELTAGVYRPMFINGTPTILEQVDGAPAGMSNDVFHYKVGNIHYYQMDGKVYRDSQSDILLLATNTHRSYMDLNKTVVDSSGDPAEDDTAFEYRISFHVPSEITNYDDIEKYIWFNVYDTEEKRTLAPSEYSYTNAETPGEMDEGYSDAEYANYLVATSGNPFTLKIKQGWNVRFLNLPVGTTYTIEETNIPAGYSFIGAEVSGTRWISNMADGADKGSEQAMSNLPTNQSAENSDTDISGRIDYANARYNTTYTNKTLTKQVKIPIKKILQGRDMEADEFSFILQPIQIDGERDDSAKQMIHNPAGNANQEVEFDFLLNYNTASIANAPYQDMENNAVYLYVVYEEQGGASDIVYSDLQYIVKVTLRQEGDSISANTEYFRYDGDGSLPDEITKNLKTLS